MKNICQVSVSKKGVPRMEGGVGGVGSEILIMSKNVQIVRHLGGSPVWRGGGRGVGSEMLIVSRHNAQFAYFLHVL